jgi:hypothetical protein
LLRLANLSADGGGIRGYGTLLILKELMKKIAKWEREFDPKTPSSFHPSEYKPRRSNPNNTQVVGLATAGIAGGNHPAATPTEGVEDWDLFLPCHYFTYIGGTSTGGYVRINRSRKVDTC